jgi:hypothetical protein
LIAPLTAPVVLLKSTFRVAEARKGVPKVFPAWMNRPKVLR